MSIIQWMRVGIQDICTDIIDCVNKTAPTVEYVTPYKMIRTTNVKNGRVNIDEVKYVTEETFHKWNRRMTPCVGDIILTREAPLGDVGKLRHKNVFLGQRLMLYRIDANKANRDFVLYSFQSHDLQAQLKSLGSGSTVEHMRVADAEKLTILIPEKYVQDKIGFILSAYDDLIENNLRRIKILEEMAQRIYQEWFVHFLFPGHENVKMVESKLGLIPEGWDVKNLFEVAEVTYGYPFKSKLFTEDIVGEPVIRIRDIRKHNSNTYTTEVAPAKYVIQNGDLLVGMDGEFHMARWAGGRAYLNQRVVRFRPNSFLSSYFFFLSIQKPIEVLNSTIVGTTVAHLSDKHLRSINIVIPDATLTQRVKQVFDPIFDEEINLRTRNANLRQIRDMLIPRLLSGELDVENLDIVIPEDNE